VSYVHGVGRADRESEGDTMNNAALEGFRKMATDMRAEGVIRMTQFDRFEVEFRGSRYEQGSYAAASELLYVLRKLDRKVVAHV
jgi:hypothetical protein